MNHPGLVERLLSELAAARVSIAASYQRLWPAAERTLRASGVDEPGQSRLRAVERRTGVSGEDRDPGEP